MTSPASFNNSEKAVSTTSYEVSPLWMKRNPLHVFGDTGGKRYDIMTRDLSISSMRQGSNWRMS